MLNKIRKLQNKKGFTLVELIVVIAIIAILTAVIVPLVGRYSAQATYSTLQDGAKTISTSVSTCLSDVTKMGTVIKVFGVTGKKSSGALSVTVYGEGSAANKCGSAKTDAEYKKLGEAIQTALQSALDDNSTFVALIKSNTCDSVLYSKTADLTTTYINDTDWTSLATSDATNKVTQDDTFKDDDAFMSNSKAIGVSGSWKPAKST